MKILLIVIFILILSIAIYFIYLGYKSHSGSAPGLTEHQLAPCPDTPNCKCSEYPDDHLHYIEAITFTQGDTDKVQQALQTSIEKSGGVIDAFETDYIAATYTSSIFRYVDDFEIRIDIENNLIHIRSASRVGRSDFGANLKRIEAFKQQFATELLANSN